VKIYTNHHWRDFLYWHDLTDKEKEEFDWMEDPDFHNFMRYRGWVYALDEFMRMPKFGSDEKFQDWDGYHNETFFSGVLVKISKCQSRYQIAHYIY